MLVWQTQIFEEWSWPGPSLYVNISHMTHVSSQAATVTAWDLHRQHFVYLAKPVFGSFVNIQAPVGMNLLSGVKGLANWLNQFPGVENIWRKLLSILSWVV